MASPAVFCVSLQLNRNTSTSSLKELKIEKPMHNPTNAKLVRSLTSLNENRPTTLNRTEVNRSNIIFLRSTTKTDIASNRNNSDAATTSHILLHTADNLSTSSTSSSSGTTTAATKPNLLLEDGGDSSNKLSQIFIQQSDLTEAVLLQSVKRLGTGTPIFLLSSHDNGNGHFLIQTTSAEDVHSVAEITDEHGNDNILLQALEGLQENETAVSSRNISTPIGSDGEPIKLPENLESLPRADHFPTQRHRWNTNEEIAAILISFDRHSEWQSKEVKIRPKSGSMLLYSRKKVRYRRDGYCWKKRKDGKTTREDHMKLKVQGTECIYGCYVHSAILPTFHRRCYWLLQNPDIVLVHYLNVPYPDDNKLAVITPSLALWADKKEWTKDELVSQLKPMFFSEDEPDIHNELEISNFKLQTAETVEAIVSQLMEKQRVARQAALVKQLECGCPDSTCADGKSCSHPMRRITSAKDLTATTSLPSSSSNTNSRPSNDNSNQVSSTTGTGTMLLTNNNSPRVYSRDTRNHQQQSTNNCNTRTGNTPPLVLSLSQLQSSGGLLILNSSNSGNSANNTNHQNVITPVSVANFVCNTNSARIKNETRNNHLVLKQEIMDTNPTPASSSSSSSSPSSSSCNNHQSTKPDNKNQRDGMEINDNLRQSVFDSAPYNRQQSQQQQQQEQSRQQQQSQQQSSQQHQTEVIMSSAPSTPSKQMDTSHEDDFKQHQNFCGDTVVLLGTDSSGSLVSKSDNSSIINGGFFNETLDLSQEDIQRTLSANMPLCSSEHPETGNSHHHHHHHHQAQQQQQQQQQQQNHHHHHHHHQHHHHQQQQNNKHHNEQQEINPMDFIDSCDVVVSPTHVVDDDVFVNLDAFDMLGEFPDLEALDSSQTAGLLDVHPSETNRQEKSTTQLTNTTNNNETNHNNNQSMEGTAKITDYSPEWAYPEGGVKVLVTGPWHSSGPYTVLFDTFPVPTTLVQSGVLRCYCPAHEAGLATLQVACDGYVISNSVIFEYKLPPREEQVAAPEPKIERSNDNLLKFTLLQRLEAMDDRLQIKQEPSDGPDCVEDSVLFSQPNFEDRLVNFCQNMTSRLWRHGEELSVSWFASHRGMTLLHLAASLGYSRLVCALLHWRAENSSLLLETEVDALSQDEDGYTPLMWACTRGHTETAVMLYKWNHTAVNMKNTTNQTCLEIARTNNHNELVKELEKLELRRDKANMLLHSNNNSYLSDSPTAISPASSIASLSSIASTSKSHDGVFLRPGAVTRSESQKYRMLNLDLDTDKMLGSMPSPLLSEPSANTRNHNGQKLIKRPSIDSGIHMSCGTENTKTKSSRLLNKQQDTTTKSSKFDRSMSLPIHSPLSTRDNSFENESLEGGGGRKMDFALCEIGNGPRSSSPLIDVEAVSDDESDIHNNSTVGEQDARVLTLAEQIIAAIPERIKNESEDMLLDSSPGPPETLQTNDTLSDVFMEPLLDQSSSSFESSEFNFEFSDHNYRYYDVGTPCSSLSPASSSCLQSPCSFTLDSPSPPPTTADFCEFFQASGTVFEKDFSNLTLSDREQRELYEAAKIIQKAYRSYKGRVQQEQDKERAAAIVIQNYYRRYKQYAYYKQMTHAAMVIQNGYRSYCEHKRFKKSQEAAVCIQNYYRNYKEQGGGRGSREGTPASGLKRTYSQRRQHQAARKIQQFMRQSKNKLQKERAEREKQAVQSADVHPK